MKRIAWMIMIIMVAMVVSGCGIKSTDSETVNDERINIQISYPAGVQIKQLNCVFTDGRKLEIRKIAKDAKKQ